jgi:hypothetical protein
MKQSRGMTMTDQQEKISESEQQEVEIKQPRFPELAELEEKIQRRLRSNQRFLERVMDEDFDETDDEFDEVDADVEDDDPDQMEEL